MAIRDIEALNASDHSMEECLKTLTRDLRKAKVTEADVISLHCDTDDSGVSAWVFYWK